MSYKRYQQNGKKHGNTTKQGLNKARCEGSLPASTRKKFLKNGKLLLFFGWQELLQSSKILEKLSSFNGTLDSLF